MNPPDLAVYRSDSPRAACVLAHGAGNGRTARSWCGSPTGHGGAGRHHARPSTSRTWPPAARCPDKPAVLEASWRAAHGAGGRDVRRTAAVHRRQVDGRAHRLAHRGAGATGLAGLFFLGYPLHPPGRTRRSAATRICRTPEPMLFVQGTARHVRHRRRDRRAAALARRAPPCTSSPTAITRSRSGCAAGSSRIRSSTASWMSWSRGWDTAWRSTIGGPRQSRFQAVTGPPRGDAGVLDASRRMRGTARLLDRVRLASGWRPCAPSPPASRSGGAARCSSSSVRSSTSISRLLAPWIAATSSFSLSCTASDSLFCDRWIRNTIRKVTIVVPGVDDELPGVREVEQRPVTATQTTITGQRERARCCRSTGRSSSTALRAAGRSSAVFARLMWRL